MTDLSKIDLARTILDVPALAQAKSMQQDVQRQFEQRLGELTALYDRTRGLEAGLNRVRGLF
jgi:hypothetical protein